MPTRYTLDPVVAPCCGMVVDRTYVYGGQADAPLEGSVYICPCAEILVFETATVALTRTLRHGTQPVLKVSLRRVNQADFALLTQPELNTLASARHAVREARARELLAKDAAARKQDPGLDPPPGDPCPI